MPFALTIAVFIIFFNILMWVVFFKKFNAFFSTDKIIEETNEKAKEIIKSINFNAGRSIDLIEDKIKQLKAVSAEAERKEQLTQLSEKVEALLRTVRLENEAQESESKGNWRKELAQMRANIVSERQKLGSRTNRNYVNAMRQLRRNPTAVSDKFKNAMEELKKNAEVK